jgi:hypothetical protein
LFIWTAGDKFSRAVEINDLLGKSDADDALWEGLKGAGITADRQVILRDRRARYRVDFWIRSEDGNLALVVGNAIPSLPRSWRVLNLSEAEIMEDLARCVDKVSRTLREMGNAKHTSEQLHEHSD